MNVRIVIVSLIALSLATLGIAQSAVRIGTTAAVSNQVTGAVGGAAKPLQVGDGVFQNQVIKTGADATTQLLFNDETALTVGPGSELTLDRFVYNPAQRAGDIVFSTTKGAFRFVTGNAKSASYKIKTPVALIGVRGTIFDWFIDQLGNLVLILVEGEVEVCPTPSTCVTVNTPGDFIIVKADGTILGPESWTGDLWNVAFGVPFPLFGRNTINNFSDLPVTLDPSDVNDALDNNNLEPPFVFEPPPIILKGSD